MPAYGSNLVLSKRGRCCSRWAVQKRGGYGLKARTVAMWLVWENCGISLREVGELFGGLNYAAVAQRLRRLNPKEKSRAEDFGMLKNTDTTPCKPCKTHVKPHVKP